MVEGGGPNELAGMSDTQYCNECGTEHERITLVELHKRSIDLMTDDGVDNTELAKRWCPRCKEYTRRKGQRT